MLGWSLRHRLIVLVIGVAAIVGSFKLMGQIGSTFMPDFDRGEMQVSFKAPPGTTLAESTVVARRLTDMLKKYPEVDYTFVTIGAGGITPVNQGAIYVKLKPKDERTKTDLDLRKDIRAELANWKGLRSSVEEAEQMGDARPIQISVRGTDLNVINQVAAQVIKNVKAVPGATDVDTTLEDPRPEVRVNLDRKAASDLGLNLGTVAATVRGLVAGEVVSQYQDADGDAYDVRLRLKQEQRRLRSDLEEIYVPVMNAADAALGMNGGRGGNSVPLSQVAQPGRIRKRRR